MSWCGGGEMSVTPGVACRMRAIISSDLWPGSWPPSPGFAPCAILICSSRALTRYSAVTPKRADATCLIALLQLRAETRAVLAALAGVAAPAERVHRRGERLVRLAADRAERHRAGREALDDLRRRFDVVERHGVSRLDEVEQSHAA